MTLASISLLTKLLPCKSEIAPNFSNCTIITDRSAIQQIVF